MKLRSFLNAARQRAFNSGVSAGLPSAITPRTVRTPSRSEVENPYFSITLTRSALFCCHKRSYFETCGSCKRDKNRAALEWKGFIKRNNLSV